MICILCELIECQDDNVSCIDCDKWIEEKKAFFKVNNDESC